METFHDNVSYEHRDVIRIQGYSQIYISTCTFICQSLGLRETCAVILNNFRKIKSIQVPRLNPVCRI